MEKEFNENNKIKSLKEGFEHFGKVTQTEKEFKTLSETIKKIDMGLLAGEKSRVFEVILASSIKEFIKIILEINQLKFPLGCDKNLRDATTRCGDISFGNKIILCDNCTQKLIEKFTENEKEIKERAGAKLTK